MRNIFILLSLSLRRYLVIHRRISAIQCSKFFKEQKFNLLSGSSDIYSCNYLSIQVISNPYRCAIIPRGRVYIVKPEDQELNPVIHQITKTEHQIKYHEQTHSGSVVPDTIETIQALG